MKIIKEPMYQQLTRILREKIQSDSFEIGDKFLTESEISTQFEVSRNTVNKAMTALISEGLLEFRKGLGSFVKMKKSQFDIHHLISFTSMAESIGKKPSTKVLEFKRMKGSIAGKKICSALQTLEADYVYYMKRLRLLNNSPSILETRYVTAELLPGLQSKDVKGSIIKMWREKYNLSLADTDQTLRAVILEDDEAELLQEEPGSPAILRESVGYLDNGVPLWYEKTLFSGRDYVFRFKIDSRNRTQATMREFVGDQDSNSHTGP